MLVHTLPVEELFRCHCKYVRHKPERRCAVAFSKISATHTHTHTHPHYQRHASFRYSLENEHHPYQPTAFYMNESLRSRPCAALNDDEHSIPFASCLPFGHSTSRQRGQHPSPRKQQQVQVLRRNY